MPVMQKYLLSSASSNLATAWQEQLIPLDNEKKVSLFIQHKLTDKQIEELADLIELSPNLESVKLSFVIQQPSKELLQKVSKALTENSTIKEAQFYGEISVEGMKTIANAFKSEHSIQKLSFCGLSSYTDNPDDIEALRQLSEAKPSMSVEIIHKEVVIFKGGKSVDLNEALADEENFLPRISPSHR